MSKKSEARIAKAIDSGLAQELRKIARILESRQICQDVSPLNAGIHLWHGEKGSGWSYRIEDLLFHSVVGPKCFPPNLLDLACRLSVYVRGYYSVGAAEDPLDHAAIEITLEGRDVNDQRLISSWHFDRHEGTSTESLEDHPDQAAHPRYHFHFGGDRMKAFAAQNDINWFPYLLLMDGPRPAHPPLDAILAIDFVLSNFFPAHWRTLRDTSDYVNVVTSAQKRLWRPYADTIPKHWMPKEEGEYWLPSDCWPSLSTILQV